MQSPVNNSFAKWLIVIKIKNKNKINKQVLYITVGATVESSVPLHYVHLSFSDDWFDNRK